MRFWSLLVGLAALHVAAQAQAQEIAPITLAPGEAATISLEEPTRPTRIAATWTRFDLVAARQLAGMTPPDEPMAEGIPINSDVRPDPIPPGEVRIRFHSIADRHALLVVENGHGLALSYRARMTRDGRTRHTDVCVVLPNLPSYEHWPHPIERIELTDFRFIRWQEGRAPTCA